jgi:hypothetical protein
MEIGAIQGLESQTVSLADPAHQFTLIDVVRHAHSPAVPHAPVSLFAVNTWQAEKGSTILQENFLCRF